MGLYPRKPLSVGNTPLGFNQQLATRDGMSHRFARVMMRRTVLSVDARGEFLRSGVWAASARKYTVAYCTNN
jgi:hypothetical protein